MDAPWYRVEDAERIASPALLVYPDRVEDNIRRMARLAGDVQRLRPHLKTTKSPDVVRMLAAQGMTRFKVATIAEAEMAAEAGSGDVLLGYQPVGPAVTRLLDLMQAFPGTRFSAIADDEGAIDAMAAAASARGLVIPLLLDLDVGMRRTGIEPGPAAAELYASIARRPGVEPRGLHAYDGHVREADPAARAVTCDRAFAPVQRLRETLESRGLPVPSIVAGGSPTFPVHARRPGVECSPGTLVFSDLGTSRNFPDLDFLYAALLLTRVVSRPGANRLCLDLGHKAVAAESPHPRVEFLNLPGASAVGHNEEHLVIETSRAPEFPVGTCLYGVPWHICPTVALHDEAVLVRAGRAGGRWPITARARKIRV